MNTQRDGRREGKEDEERGTRSPVRPQQEGGRASERERERDALSHLLLGGEASDRKGTDAHRNKITYIG